MRLKKGFTLAEILIVLVTIGVIATLTIPSMMKGVVDAQYKTAYKKAYNTIANAYSMESTTNGWPAKNSNKDLEKAYVGIANNISLKEILQEGDDGNLTPVSCVNFANLNKKIGDETSDSCSEFSINDEEVPTWLVTDDNIAYKLGKGGAYEDSACSGKMKIGNTDSEANAASESCFVVTVDVDGLSKGNNDLETQTLTEGTPMERLINDRYEIYIGKDGLSAGNRTQTISGRIMADLK